MCSIHRYGSFLSSSGRNIPQDLITFLRIRFWLVRFSASGSMCFVSLNENQILVGNFSLVRNNICPVRNIWYISLVVAMGILQWESNLDRLRETRNLKHCESLTIPARINTITTIQCIYFPIRGTTYLNPPDSISGTTSPIHCGCH